MLVRCIGVNTGLENDHHNPQMSGDFPFGSSPISIADIDLSGFHLPFNSIVTTHAGGIGALPQNGQDMRTLAPFDKARTEEFLVLGLLMPHGAILHAPRRVRSTHSSTVIW